MSLDYEPASEPLHGGEPPAQALTLPPYRGTSLIRNCPPPWATTGS